MTNKANILYIEDDESLSHLVKRKLSRCGYDVEVAHDGLMAINMIKNATFDALIVDYNLPDITGLQILQNLADAGLTIPAVMVSGGDDIRVAVAAMKLGCFDYIVKETSGSFTELLSVHLSNLLSRRDLELKQQQIKLEKNRIQDSLIQAQHLAHLGNWEWHAGQQTAWWSDEEYRIFGVDKEHFKTTLDQYHTLIYVNDLDLVKRMEDMSLEEDICAVYEYRIVRPNGELRWLSAKVETEKDEDGNLVRSFGITQDITERKHAEKQLQLAQQVFENTTEGILVADANSVIVSVNPAFTEITGFLPEDVLGETHKVLSSGKHDREFYDEIWNTLATEKQWSGEIWNRKKNGEPFPEWLSITAISDDNGTVEQYVSIFSDITQHKEAEKLIEYQANYDALTGLINRNLFNDRLARTLVSSRREQQRFSLLFIDLDKFKEINDTLGHRAGDELLKKVAERLLLATRESDTVSRLGGDEFTIIIPNLQNELNAKIVAEKVLAKLATPFQLDTEEVQISASVGITVFPDDATDVDALYRNADHAMYAAKEAGRNQFSFFTSQMQQEVEVRLVLANELKSALDNDEFEVYYQAIIDPKNESLYGAEALIRWNHPTKGIIDAAAFISLAEESGLIRPIGMWVLKTVVEQISLWQTQGFDMHVSVNKSYKQFHTEECIDDFSQLLEEFNVSPDSLSIEVKETMFMESDERSVNLLQHYQRAGIGITLDNFGTGYSSMSTVQKFPFKLIKVDRSLTANMLTDKKSASMMESILFTAHKLDLKVVVQGVETVEQQTFLTKNKCDLFQGDLYSPATSVAEFEQQYLFNKEAKQSC